MQIRFYFQIAAVLLSSAVSAQALELTTKQKSTIGRKIWQNECAGTVSGLTTWNAGEAFPSLGIGHFIWYPADVEGKYEESWPAFVKFVGNRSELPSVAKKSDAPWRTKSEFEKNFKSPEMSELRNWLAAHVDLQVEFIIRRSEAALRKISKTAPPNEQIRITENYYKVAKSSQGVYALIDYVNFKGEGVQVSERYKGYGWGLMQVLGNMKDVPSGNAAATEFSAAAKRILSRRIANSPPAAGEKRWELGWHNRCATYAQPL